MNVIDHSQYYMWKQCQWKWYEKYVAKMEKRKSGGFYNDNALTFGSLVHAGLEEYKKHNRVEIPPGLMAELGVSPEAFASAQDLVRDYRRIYPNEDFEIHYEELPLMFEVGVEEWEGMAKVDRFFYLPTPTVLEVGSIGEPMVLEAGWWIQEYKTKDASVDRGKWQMNWTMAMQADFQMHALAKKIGEMPRGLLIQVLEKPRMYVPKRKCKGCGGMFELRTYVSTGEGHACPFCAFTQKLDPYKPKVEHHAAFWRCVVTRNKERLDWSLGHIRQTAQAMDVVKKNPLLLDPDMTRCMDNRFGACEFFEAHVALEGAAGHEKFVQVDTTKYMGLDEKGVDG